MKGSKVIEFLMFHCQFYFSLLGKKKLHKFELACLANLCPETADEAKALIPRWVFMTFSTTFQVSQVFLWLSRLPAVWKIQICFLLTWSVQIFLTFCLSEVTKRRINIVSQNLAKEWVSYPTIFLRRGLEKKVTLRLPFTGANNKQFYFKKYQDKYKTKILLTQLFNSSVGIVKNDFPVLKS